MLAIGRVRVRESVVIQSAGPQGSINPEDGRAHLPLGRRQKALQAARFSGEASRPALPPGREYLSAPRQAQALASSRCAFPHTRQFGSRGKQGTQAGGATPDSIDATKKRRIQGRAVLSRRFWSGHPHTLALSGFDGQDEKQKTSRGADGGPEDLRVRFNAHIFLSLWLRQLGVA